MEGENVGDLLELLEELDEGDEQEREQEEGLHTAPENIEEAKMGEREEEARAVDKERPTVREEEEDAKRGQVKRRVQDVGEKALCKSSDVAFGPAVKRRKCDGGVCVEENSGFSIKNVAVPLVILNERLSGRSGCRFRKLPTLSLMRGTEAEGKLLQGEDWVTVGIVTDKGSTKVSKSGSKFANWTITDLEGSEIVLFLFGDAYKSHWKEMEGTVVMLKRASLRVEDHLASVKSTLQNAFRKRRVAFSIDKEDQLEKLGMSGDYGLCRGTRADGSPCTMAIHRGKMQYCNYHVGQARRQAFSGKLQNTRLEFSSGNLMSSIKGTRKQQQAGVYFGVNTLGRPPSKVGAQASSGQLRAISKMESKARPLSHGSRYLTSVADTVDKVGIEEAAGEIKRIRQLPKGEEVHKPLVALKKNFGLSMNKGGNFGKGTHPNAMRNVVTSSGATMKIPSRDRVAAVNAQLCGGFVSLDYAAEVPAANDAEKYAKVLSAVKASGIHNRIPDPNAKANRREPVPVKQPPPPRPPPPPPPPDEQHRGKEGCTPPRTTTRENSPPPLSRDGLNRILQKSERSSSSSSTFADAFGSSLKKAEDDQGSRYRNVFDEERMDKLMKSMKGLEQQEQLQQQLEAVRSVEVSAYACKKCKIIHEKKLEQCVHQGHMVTVLKATKRFFQCNNCGRRTQSLNSRLPRRPCRGCGSNSFTRTGMYAGPRDTPKGPANIASKENLKPRGEEFAFSLKQDI